MGRSIGKLKVELIENQKSRKQTFKRRRECVLRKIKELSTLCDVSACLVIFSPDDPASVWPPNDPALVDRLVHRKLDDSKNDDDDDDDFALRVAEKAQLVSAQIERLKRVADQQQDQFFASTAMMVMPAGGANRDDDGKAQSVVVDVQKKAQQLARDLTIEDAQQQQDQLGHSIFDQLGHSIFDQLGHSIFDQFPEQQQQFDLFGGSSSMTVNQGEDPMMMMDDPAYQSWCTMAGFGGQEEEGAFGGGDDVAVQGEDPMMMMMMMDDSITADQSWCTMAGFGPQEEEEGTQTAAGGGDDVAVQDCNFYNDDFAAHLFTPPMMTWQSSTDEDFMLQDNGAAFDCIDFEDLWA